MTAISRIPDHATDPQIPAERENTTPGALSPGTLSLSWADELRRVSSAVSKTNLRVAPGHQRIFYLLHWRTNGRKNLQAFGVSLRKGRDPDNAEEWWDLESALRRRPPYVSDEDLQIIALLLAAQGRSNGLRAFSLEAPQSAEILRRMARTGRLCPASDLSPLTLAGARPAALLWQHGRDGLQHPLLQVSPSADLIIPLTPPWYIDLEAGVIGEIGLSGPRETLTLLLSSPGLSAREAARIRTALGESGSNLRLPAIDAAVLRQIRSAPVALLRLYSITTHGNTAWRAYQAQDGRDLFDLAEPVFRYEDAEVRPGDADDFCCLPDGEAVHVVRRPEQECALLAHLHRAGLQAVPDGVLRAFGSPPDGVYGLAREEDWPAFMRQKLAELRDAGWQIEFDSDFRHHFVEVDAWDAALIDAGNDWFDLDMGIVVEGERVPLAPLLAALFRRDGRWRDIVQVSGIDDAEFVELRMPDLRRVRVPAARLKPLALALVDLFDRLPEGPHLRISRFDAPRLREFSDPRRWQFNGQRDVLALADRLRSAQGIGDIEPPRGLALDLRRYQREGLAWLQFLREQNLAGILADDMGLGKTAQALAHLLLEKESGRLDRPALVVLPTSLIFNWRNEAMRFAPGLSVLSLHGAERKARFAEIADHDVVLTTYPLLWRDADALTRHPYHLLILDEAQTVKNARSRSAEIVRRIEARHRLCLTGTPLENHLGELWSQFDFLLPGFLGSRSNFTRYWRTPIEKMENRPRRDLLARRVRPFILRRRKEDVARELPPKTEIVRKVSLSGGQRDLYETVRVAMDVAVREEVFSKGFGHSQIVILDALLKLRQVCCDPRLVRLPLAQRVKERAKLEMLMTLLPGLIEEGRRILVFSQFTQMLALIEAALRQKSLDYALLTGDTKDRETPVRRFQSGEVPVFLISLKAGGIGLNLTAADTVIHFDPWWNPAAENQATDRAHRIGQDKPVFVYKLIVAGSIEEKILALQERKAGLADGILSDDRAVRFKFGEEDVAALFAPLPS